jgi:hypothetical protein
MPKPVTVEEVGYVVLRAIAEAFDGRPLNIDVARKGLAMAAFDMIQMHLKEASEQDHDRPGN